MLYKVCSKCGELKHIDEFSTDNRSPSKKYCSCKECCSNSRRKTNRRSKEEAVKKALRGFYKEEGEITLENMDLCDVFTSQED
jgi:hypothetical protein